MSRIFISYKRTVEPDHPIATQIFSAISQHHEVFIDQIMSVGTRWAEQIELELRRTDYMIVFLSEHSVRSEMVLAEVETAHHLSKTNNGRPIILPVRLAYRDPFQYPLSAYLNAINWAYWSGPDDTVPLIEELLKAISGGNLAIDEQKKVSFVQITSEPALPEPSAFAQPPSRLEMPEGTMMPQSKYYVERSLDALALREIEEDSGVTITIKGPRQMGKSSLLIRVIDAAVKSGKQVAFLDFQLFNKAAFSDADTFFYQFATWLVDELGLDDKIEEHWKPQLGNSQRCSRYVERYLLAEVEQPILLAMDEVESVFDTPFRSDFFSMLRSWHNSRATKAAWRKLSLAFVTSTEPYQFIDNLNLSPFNVGLNIELGDLSKEQVADLNLRHGSPFNSSEERELFALLNGHPYLTRRALYLVASHQITPVELFKQAIHDRGPFGDHLRYHLFRMQGKTELIKALLHIISKNVLPDDEVAFRLQSAGLVRKTGNEVMPRCKLYSAYYGERLNA